MAGLKWVDVDGGTGAAGGIWGIILLFSDREIEEGNMISGVSFGGREWNRIMP